MADCQKRLSPMSLATLKIVVHTRTRFLKDKTFGPNNSDRSEHGLELAHEVDTAHE